MCRVENVGVWFKLLLTFGKNG